MDDKTKDLEEQYLLLEEEEKEANKKKLILLIIIFILIIIVSIIGATFSYQKYKEEYIPTPACTVNCDTNGDGKPDLNVDYEKNGKVHFNVDTDGDTKPDFNLMNQNNDSDKKCDLNCDNNKDGWPDFNVDLDGDGIADLNIKRDGNKLINMDTNGDGICDVKCNGILDEVPSDGEDNIVLTIETHDNRIFYIGTTKTYFAYDIIPGWKDVIEFKVVNNTNKNGFYSMKWEDITNTITELNNITYRISKNNMLVKDETRAPYNNTDILHKVMIPANSTHTYKLELEFKETWVDQSEDKNKEFRATIHMQAVN